MTQCADEAGCAPESAQDVTEHVNAKNTLVPLLTRRTALPVKLPLIGLQGDD